MDDTRGRVLAELKKYVDSAVTAAGLTKYKLRQAFVKVLKTHLLHNADGRFETYYLARGKAYVDAVLEFVESAALKYPADPCAVAKNPFLRPVPHVTTKSEAVEGVVLVGAGKRVFADPLTVAVSEAHPRDVAGVVIGGRCFSFREAAIQLKNVFAWDKKTFPVKALVVADSSGQAASHLMMPNAWGKWTVISMDELRGFDPTHGGELQLSNKLQPSDEPIGDPVEVEDAFRDVAGRRFLMQRFTSSAAKGAAGEAYVLNLLQRTLPYEVRRVSRKARSADIEVAVAWGKISVDVKDYTTAVPEKEVAKFRRDLGSRGSAAGVLVSLSSGVVGVQGRLAVKMEVLPFEGRAAPVVYVSSAHADVVVAGVELAAYLSKAATAPSGRGGDVLCCTSDLEENADLYEDVKNRLGQHLSNTMDSVGDLINRLTLALRDQRRISRTQRALATDYVEVAASPKTDVWTHFTDNYAIPDHCKKILCDVVVALSAGDTLGDIRELAQWRLYKGKVKHLATETSIVFSKTRAEVCVALAVHLGRVDGILRRHPGLTKVGNGVLSLVVDDSTGPDIISLVSRD